MKEVIIKYKDSKTLGVLKILAKYLNFSVSFPRKAKIDKIEYDYIKGIPVIPGNSTIDVNQLTAIFTGKNLDAKKLRAEAWQRQNNLRHRCNDRLL